MVLWGRIEARCAVLIVATLVAILPGGCSANPADEGIPQALAAPVPGTPFEVRVVNSRAIPMTVGYRYGSDILTVLGTVPAGATATFSVPSHGTDDLKLEASDGDGGNVVRRVVNARAGDAVNLELK